jgi:hypothetical protein
MKVVVALIVLALIALAIYLVLTAMTRAREVPWKVITHTREDGTYVVAVRSEGGERVVRELPPALEGYDLASELRLAREEAQAQADELNRSAGS